MQLEFPAQFPCLLHIAMCSGLCNESTLQYNPDKKNYEKIGESTEVALRVLVEKVSNLSLSIIASSKYFFQGRPCLYIVENSTYFNLCQVGLPGFDSMPSALNMLSKHERASYCNHYWEHQFKKVCVFLAKL